MTNVFPKAALFSAAALGVAMTAAPADAQYAGQPVPLQPVPQIGVPPAPGSERPFQNYGTGGPIVGTPLPPPQYQQPGYASQVPVQAQSSGLTRDMIFDEVARSMGISPSAMYAPRIETPATRYDACDIKPHEKMRLAVLLGEGVLSSRPVAGAASIEITETFVSYDEAPALKRYLQRYEQTHPESPHIQALRDAVTLTQRMGPSLALVAKIGDDEGRVRIVPMTEDLLLIFQKKMECGARTSGSAAGLSAVNAAVLKASEAMANVNPYLKIQTWEKARPSYKSSALEIPVGRDARGRQVVALVPPAVLGRT